MPSNVLSLALSGIDAIKINVETDTANAIPAFEIVGLPDAAVKESRERVKLALRNSRLYFPIARLTVNLAPGGVKKEGPIYDLPIAVGIMLLEGRIDASATEKAAFVGELSLDGRVCRIDGVLPMTIGAMKMGIERLFVPYENMREASAVAGIEVYGVKNLNELYAHLLGQEMISPAENVPFEISDPSEILGDFSEVRGQDSVKRGLEIACSGFHNVLMIGSPGSGKSMLAKRIPTIMPPITFEEAIDVTQVYSVAGMLSENSPMISIRPFRSPHHTVSAVGLSGGGKIPRPGEVSLAHHGVLFLDELPEFQKNALEILRQPLEDGKVTITRVGGTITYPCDFMLVCAMNPCRCGYLGHPTRKCTCSELSVTKYLSKISGPLLDRIDLHLETAPVPYEALSSREAAETSKRVLERVNRAREIQKERFRGTSTRFNGRLTSSQIREFCRLGEKENEVMKNAFEKLSLSARAHDKILRVSRTIADLDGKADIEVKHILEAISYRSLDRKYFSGM
ncbi:MAG: YifB family Mg chelatase-like AAA ATPase [Clostridia bacterium]|nr:YifB family Mg chelatase-like AAA ATPase [Clostridia bacterium]MBQ4249300.1 YifB family Mg chelatase-like AAA ATPase [Clostridia bacterium]